MRSKLHLQLPGAGPQGFPHRLLPSSLATSIGHGEGCHEPLSCRRTARTALSLSSLSQDSSSLSGQFCHSRCKAVSTWKDHQNRFPSSLLSIMELTSGLGACVSQSGLSPLSPSGLQHIPSQAVSPWWQQLCSLLSCRALALGHLLRIPQFTTFAEDGTSL